MKVPFDISIGLAAAILLAATAFGCRGEVTVDHGAEGDDPIGEVNNGCNPDIERCYLPDGGIVGPGDDPTTACVSAESYAREVVIPAVVTPRCMNCHVAGGIADEAGATMLFGAGAFDENFARLTDAARSLHEGESLLLAKPVDATIHAGGEVISRDSEEFARLERFVSLDAAGTTCEDSNTVTDFWTGVAPLTPRQQWRKITLNLASRLPTEAELQRVDDEGTAAFDALLPGVMDEELFYVRLREGYGDVLLTKGAPADEIEIDRILRGYSGGDWQTEIRDEHPVSQKIAQRRGDEGLRQAPVRLAEHLARNGEPFSGILTADYVMLNPYSARNYNLLDVDGNPTRRDGNGDRVTFDDVWNFEDFKPIRLPGPDQAIEPNTTIADSNSFEQWDAFPHAGVITTAAWRSRWPTTRTSKNRTRANVFAKTFLDFDFEALGNRDLDSADEVEDVQQAVVDNPQCSACHSLVDPIAHGFRSFNEKGTFIGTNRDRYHRGNMILPPYGSGYFGEKTAPEFEDRRHVWLAARTINDARFSRAIAKQVYSIVFERKMLEEPIPPAEGAEEVAWVEYRINRLAYEVEREMLDEAQATFEGAGLDIKSLFALYATSDLFLAERVEGEPSETVAGARRLILGTERMLTPEKLERRILATTGMEWEILTFRGSYEFMIRPLGEPDALYGDRLPDLFYSLYGGVDHFETTERVEQPSGVTAAVMNILAEDLACQVVAREAALGQDERTVFADHDLQSADEAAVRAVIAGHFERFTGQLFEPDSEPVSIVWELWDGVRRDGALAVMAGEEPSDLPTRCSTERDAPTEDASYRRRAWSAVLSFFFQTYDFLYE